MAPVNLGGVHKKARMPCFAGTRKQGAGMAHCPPSTSTLVVVGLLRSFALTLNSNFCMQVVLKEKCQII